MAVTEMRHVFFFMIDGGLPQIMILSTEIMHHGARKCLLELGNMMNFDSLIITNCR